MNSGNGQSIATRLVRWSAALELSHVPEDAAHVARRCIIDTLGVAIAGSRMPVAMRIADHVAQEYRDGDCTVFGKDSGATASGAALVNGTAAHVLDFDDTSYAGVLHGSTVVIPAVFGAAEHADISGEQFLAAFIAGSEAAYALGMTLTNTHYMSGWWATTTIGAIGAAAGAAKALGLSREETIMAVSFSALQANGMIAVLGSDAKPILAGQAARLGLQSALLAAQGNSASENVFENPRGFLKLMNEGRQDEAGLANLGTIWRLLEPGIAIKHAPVCSAAQTAIEVAEKLIADNKLERSQIKSVRCEVPHLVKISLIYDRPVSASQAQFSMPFAVGCILAFGRLGPEQISDETLENHELRDAMTWVEMVEAGDLNESDFQPQFPECARVTLSTTSGDDFTGFLGAATGMPANPMSDDDLSEKFRNCTAFAGWSDQRASAVLERLWDIENAGPVRALLRGDA